MDVADGRSAVGWLREVEVRPVRGVDERRRWDALMREHHYLPFRGLFGKSLRHVAVRGEAWLALLGWQAGAFKVGVRDAWIGWTRERQFARLHLIANNARFAVLPAGRVPNLASRALGLSLRRLPGDVRDAHGHPVLLAETFVDPSRYAGTCYRASNWVWLGRTRGFAREPGGSARWREHGRPKEVYVYDLGTGGAAALRADALPGDCRAEAGPPPPASELRSLHAFLEGMPDFRKARGVRYGLACYATIMIAARLAGYRGGGRVRRVRGAAGPGAAAGGGRVLQPEPAAPDGAGGLHVPLHPVVAAAGRAGPGAGRVGAPLQRGRAGGAGRQGRARRLDAGGRRARHAGRRRRARQRAGARPGAGGRQDQRDPGGARTDPGAVSGHAEALLPAG